MDFDFRRDVLPERDDKSAQKSPDKLFKTLKFYGSGKPKAALREDFCTWAESDFELLRCISHQSMFQ